MPRDFPDEDIVMGSESGLCVAYGAMALDRALTKSKTSWECFDRSQEGKTYSADVCVT
jgi:hypothetical protein